MIEINLLPRDRRPTEKTPLPRFILVVAGVALVCVEIVLAFLFLLIRIPGGTRHLESLKEMRKQRLEEAKRADKLEAQIAEIETRRKAVEALYAPGKVLRWSDVLDQLDEEEVLPEPVWLTRFEVKSTGTMAAATATMTGYVRGAGQDRQANLNRFIKNLNDNEQVGKRFESVVPVKFGDEKLRVPQDNKASSRPLPDEALGFELELTIKQPKPPAPAPRAVGTPR